MLWICENKKEKKMLKKNTKRANFILKCEQPFAEKNFKEQAMKTART